MSSLDFSPLEHDSIDMSIYVMPAFAILEVSDLDRARRWYVEAVGFRVLVELPGPDGHVAVIHLRRFRFQDLLVRPGLSSSGAPTGPVGPAMTFAAGDEDIDAAATRAAALATELGGTVSGPTQMPWNTRDVTFTDPDGYRVTLSSYSPMPNSEFTPEAMAEVMRRTQSGGE